MKHVKDIAAVEREASCKDWVCAEPAQPRGMPNETMERPFVGWGEWAMRKREARGDTMNILVLDGQPVYADALARYLGRLRRLHVLTALAPAAIAGPLEGVGGC